MRHYREALSVLSADERVLRALELASSLELPNWCIAGGFLRDLCWSEALRQPAAPRDIDLIYFDRSDTSPERDWALEERVAFRSTLPFSVRNQARMHVFNREGEYADLIDAMSKFPSTVSAIGLRLDAGSRPVLFSVFGLEALCEPVFQITPHFWEQRRQADFFAYLNRNNVRKRWPQVPTGLEMDERAWGKVS